jgi:hypothetical protein
MALFLTQNLFVASTIDLFDYLICRASLVLLRVKSPIGSERSPFADHYNVRRFLAPRMNGQFFIFLTNF